MITPEIVFQKLKECCDPEIPVNIVDLGLIYDVAVAEDGVKVKMTMTSPGCPLHASMAESVKRKLKEIEGVGKAEVEIVWQPPWTPQRMAPELRRRLGLS